MPACNHVVSLPSPYVAVDVKIAECYNVGKCAVGICAFQDGIVWFVLTSIENEVKYLTMTIISSENDCH